MTITDRPPVKPVEGHYALLRNGGVVMPSEIVAYGTVNWNEDGSWDDSKYHENDIIATISPADMQAVASGELERLKEALELAIAANCKMKDALSFYADDGPTPNVDGPWKATSWDFGAFARCTLADVANIEGGKNP